jgi:hypothetical protein
VFCLPQSDLRHSCDQHANIVHVCLYLVGPEAAVDAVPVPIWAAKLATYHVGDGDARQSRWYSARSKLTSFLSNKQRNSTLGLKHRKKFDNFNLGVENNAVPNVYANVVDVLIGDAGESLIEDSSHSKA